LIVFTSALGNGGRQENGDSRNRLVSGTFYDRTMCGLRSALTVPSSAGIWKVLRFLNAAGFEAFCSNGGAELLSRSRNVANVPGQLSKGFHFT